MLIGLTGGAGSGKSTVAQIFRTWGAEVIDADRIGHALLLPGAPCYREVAEAFGPGVLYPNKRIDRQALGNIVFGDARQMKRLNAIVHPHLLAEIAFQVLRLKRKKFQGLAVIDAALIVQWGMQRQLDRLVVVDAPEPVRLQRLRANGLPAERAKQVIASQLSAAALRQSADIVLTNGGDLAALKRQAKTAWELITGK